jgi:hypothetical protein
MKAWSACRDGIGHSACQKARRYPFRRRASGSGPFSSLTTELLQMRQVNFAYASVDTVGGTAIDAADFFVGRLRFGKGGCDLLCPFAIARDLFLGSIDLSLDLGGQRPAARAVQSAFL